MINIMSESPSRLCVKVSQPKPPEGAERLHFCLIGKYTKMRVFLKQVFDEHMCL